MCVCVWACTLGAFAAFLAGCSSSKQTVQVGTIQFTDANGNAAKNAVRSINAGATTYVDVQLTDDKQLLGVDWTVTCGSAPPPGTPLPPGVTQDDSCGIFSPVHTASAPVPSYASSGSGVVTLFTAPAAPPKQGVVTLYAAATVDHSRYTSVTLTVVGLPISIQFGASPVSTMPIAGTASFKAVLTNDYVSGGVNWTATCGASACGSFSPAKTASGVATDYTAPASVPPGGTVVVSATSVTDPTKSISTTVTIEPVTVSVAAASSSVETGATDLVSAIVANDVTNAGVDWTLSCDTADACGTIDPHTASGTAATYTAPDNVPGSGNVTIRATSTADKSAFATQAVTVTPSTSITGIVLSAHQPVRGASVYLYAAGTTGYGSQATLLNGADNDSTVTDVQGHFKIPGSFACPSSSSQLYLVARGGNAGGGENPNIALLGWVGACSGHTQKQGLILNEVSTVASAYALSQFMQDAQHLGAPAANAYGIAAAGSLIDDLVDPATGKTRQRTVKSNGLTPYRQVSALANVLHRCVATGGGSAGDGSPCGQLMSIAGGNASADTLQALLFVAHHATDAKLASPVFDLGADAGAFEPTLQAVPADWNLGITFRADAMGLSSANLARSSWIDASGNRWTVDLDTRLVTELIGVSAPDPSKANQQGGR